MAVSKDLFDEARLVPETDEVDWDNEVTTILSDLLDGADRVLFRDSSLNIGIRLQSATSSLAASATLTPTAPIHKVQGSGGAVTLDTTTAIADGEKDGQVLRLVGLSDTNTVSIEHDSNVQLNGNVTLRKYEVLVLVWESTNGEWVEHFRNF